MPGSGRVYVQESTYRAETRCLELEQQEIMNSRACALRTELSPLEEQSTWVIFPGPYTDSVFEFCSRTYLVKFFSQDNFTLHFNSSFLAWDNL